MFVEIAVRGGSIYFAWAVHGCTPASIKLCMGIMSRLLVDVCEYIALELTSLASTRTQAS